MSNSLCLSFIFICVTILQHNDQSLTNLILNIFCDIYTEFYILPTRKFISSDTSSLKSVTLIVHREGMRISKSYLL